METVVEARGVSRRYGRFWALRGLDLDLRPGEAVALLGANGAGKSTLLSLLATLARPSEGTLRIGGRDPREHAAEVRRSMGYVAHHTLLDDALSARENLHYYGALFGLEDLSQRVDQRLAEVGLAERAQDRVEGFSRGMRQRLSLARSLLHDPTLLVLDEPFTGLDAPGCRDLSDRLQAEKARGAAMVLATHQLDYVLQWADRVVVLHLGRKIEELPAATHDDRGWAAHLTDVAAAREVTP